MKFSIGNIFSRKQNPVAKAVTMLISGGQGAPQKANLATQAKEGYMLNIIVYACVRMIARAAASVPWCLYSIDANGEKEELLTHPYLTLINRPNPLQSQSEFIHSLVGYLYISGNTYLQAVGAWEPSQPMPQNRAPIELYALRPDRVKILPDPINIVGGYRYKLGQNELNFPRENILHLKLFHPLDDFYGLSPIEVASVEIDKVNEGNKWNSSLLRNSAVPSGIVTSENELTDNAFQRLESELKEKFSGARNARKIAVLDSDLKWQEIAMNPKDMDWINGNKEAVLAIANAFGVPGELIGLVTNYKNKQEARKIFASEVIVPLLSHLRDELNNWLTPHFGNNLYLNYDKDSIEALQEDRIAVWDRAKTSEFLTINEKREMVGYEPLKSGGDEILIPFNLSPLNSALSSPQQDIEEPPKWLDGAPSIKILNPPDNASRRREIQKVGQLRKRFELILRARVNAQFKVDAKTVSAAFSQGGKHAALSAVLAHEQNWQQIVSKHWFGTMEFFGDRVLSGLKMESGFEIKAFSRDLFVRASRVYAQRIAGQRVVDIGKTTKDKISAVIDQGLEDGSPMTDIRDSILETYDGFSEGRAMVIARTETLGAQNRGGIESVRSLGLDGTNKVWGWSGVSRTDHADADGQMVGLDEQFSVGGEMMDSPGDPSASPEQTINCGCSLTYSLA